MIRKIGFCERDDTLKRLRRKNLVFCGLMLHWKKKVTRKLQKAHNKHANYCSAVEGCLVVDKLARSINFEKMENFTKRTFYSLISKLFSFFVKYCPDGHYEKLMSGTNFDDKLFKRCLLTNFFKLFWCFCNFDSIACLNYYENNSREIVNSSVRHVLTVSPISNICYDSIEVTQ